MVLLTEQLCYQMAAVETLQAAQQVTEQMAQARAMEVNQLQAQMGSATEVCCGGVSILFINEKALLGLSWGWCLPMFLG